MTACYCPGCELAGTAWPTILVAQLGADVDAPPFLLEIPRAVCDEHQPAFLPSDFIPEVVREYLRWLASTWKGAEPDFDRLRVEWAPLDHPTFLAFDGNEARFLAPASVE